MSGPVFMPIALTAQVEAAARELRCPKGDVLAAAFLALLRRIGPMAPETVGIRRSPEEPVTYATVPAAGATLADIVSAPCAGAGASSVRFGVLAADDEPAELSLEVEHARGGLRPRWRTGGMWAGGPLAQRLPEYYLRLLESAVSAPHVPLSELSLLSEADLDLLRRWAGPPDRFPFDMPVHETVRLQAAHTPDAFAVVRGREALTYGELNARANQLARMLRTHGAGPETTVGLLMERSTEMLVAFLAVLKTGAAAVLLDPAHPEQRLLAAVALARPRALLTLARLGGARTFLSGGVDVPVIQVDADWARIHLQPKDDLDVPVHPDATAYVVHTSGSTGEPKRVAVLHRSVAHAVRSHQEGHRISGADRASWLAPPGSSVSVGELWPYLAAGASVHIAEPETVASPTALRDWIVEQRITKTYASMPMAESLFTLPWPESAALRLLTVGSDKVRRWAGRQLPFEVAVACGSSEANGISSCLVPWERRLTSATASDAHRASPPPVGRPWPGVLLRLLDTDLRPVPPGAVGELYVGGPELARGYLEAPGHTAARFVPDPYGPPGGRLYRTGDLARFDSEGFVHHSGRIDHEFKIRGFRVNPGEVESALLSHPAVRDAVIIPVTHPDGSRQLAAYVVPEGQTEPARLRAHMTASLPAHLVPAAYELLRALPLTVNGKVDRAALPPVAWSAARAEYQPPRDELERELVEIFTEVLKVDGIGRLDDFFHLGGDSLSGTRLAVRVKRRLRQRVTIRELLRNPTPAALAGRLRPVEPRPTSAVGR